MSAYVPGFRNRTTPLGFRTLGSAQVGDFEGVESRVIVEAEARDHHVRVRFALQGCAKLKSALVTAKPRPVAVKDFENDVEPKRKLTVKTSSVSGEPHSKRM